MTKILLIMSSILVIFSFSKAQDSVSPSSPSLLDASSASLYQNLVIQSAASKLMKVPLPEDLQIKLGQVLTASEAGFSLCDLVSVGVSPPTIFNKKSKKCALKQFKMVITQLALIEQEAILRNATSSTTTTTTTTTPVPTTLAPTTPSTTTTISTTIPVPTTLAPTTPSTTITPAPTTTELTTSSTTTTATTPAPTTSPPTTSTTTTITPPPTILPTTTELESDDLL